MPGGQVPIASLARVIRSKNAGPFQLTIDFLFRDRAAYDLVESAGVLTRESVARAYGIPLARVQGIYFWRTALAVKVTLDREISAGAPGDNDCYGAQQHAPLLALGVPVPEKRHPDVVRGSPRAASSGPETVTAPPRRSTSARRGPTAPP